MAEAQLHGVARLLTERWVEDGEYLCHQGDEGNELYIIVQGEVDIIDESSGANKIIHTDREGSCIGELAVLESIPRVYAMRAKGDARLLVLEGTHFQSLIREHPDMSYRVIRLLVRRLADMPTEMSGEDSD
jgi:CRP-like cAMP-binding protein